LLPLLAGLAVVEAARTVGRVPAELKWPNDVVVEGRKLGGILVERVDMAVVVGVGLNVTLRRAELPVPTATSLALEAGGTDREALVKEVLRALARRLAAWEAADGAPESILPAYRSICATIGQHVSVSLPGGSEIVGCVTGVDDTGRLVVDVGGTSRVVAAGDVVHVRPGV
jgi:BirA family biotin operon repressor/biotin-[acetyl-CoA-carboxylase] ligase